MSAAPPVPWAGLAALLAGVAIQRLGELRLSARHAARLRERGAVEHGRGHFPLFVVLHALWPAALALEVILLGARPGRGWPLALGVLAAAEVLRYSAIRALGERWNVRVWVVPGEPPARSGVYRFIRHPNYLAVALELVAAPLLFGAWRTALAASIVNGVALAIRIPVEERALGRRR